MKKTLAIAIMISILGITPYVMGQEEYVSFERRDTSFYSTFFKKQLYDPFFGLLDPLRLIRKITFSKPSALDVNRYDEVIESSFFVNRAGKQPLTTTELVNAPWESQDPGPSMEGPWTILKGKTDGVTPGFFIKDSKGDRFLIKFDPRSNPEMTTSAEIIAHKLFYAFGYNVPSYSLVFFTPDILKVDPNATYYTEDGFKAPLSLEKAIDMLKRDAPMFRGGKYRTSASRIIEGELLGYFDLDEKRPKEPKELIPPDRLRSMRALQVFGAWTNNYDIHRKNTMEVVTTQDGKQAMKRYLLDFGSSFGSSAYRPKVPVVGFETMVDVDEIIRATGYLKTSEKPWEIRWDENEQVITHPNLGYFDNRKFNPGKWKSNLFHVTFNYLTEADGYWAAKIISTFTDEDIKAVVRTGGLSDPEAERLLTKILIDRRDMIIHYWFNKVSPLENFEIQEGSSGLELQFDDWGVEKTGVTNRSYSYEVLAVNGKKKKLLTKGESQEPTLTIPTAPSERILVEISAHKGDKKNRPVKVTFDPRAPFSILSIEH